MNTTDFVTPPRSRSSRASLVLVLGLLVIACGSKGSEGSGGAAGFKKEAGAVADMSGPDLKYEITVPSEVQPCEKPGNGCYRFTAGEQHLSIALIGVSADREIRSEADAKAWVTDNFGSNLERGGDTKAVGSDFSVEIASDVAGSGTGVAYFAKGKSGRYLVARCFGKFDTAKIVQACHSLKHVE